MEQVAFLFEVCREWGVCDAVREYGQGSNADDDAMI